MDDVTRREMLRLASAAGAIAVMGTATAETEAKGQDKKPQVDYVVERKRVMECGMTEAEADCWEVVARAAGKFFDLPDLHPMDDQEVAQAIHIIQHKLLSRPAYRRYLELARKGK